MANTRNKTYTQHATPFSSAKVVEEIEAKRRKEKEDKKREREKKTEENTSNRTE